MTRYFFDDPFLFPHSVFDEVIKSFHNRQPSFPLYDVYNEEDKVVVEYALAGYTANQLDVWTEGTKLCVSAVRTGDSTKGRKIASRSFSNSFEAKGLDLENVKVSFLNGILRIEVPRIMPAEPEKKTFEIITDKKLLK